jgi:transposase InsO family protein
MRNIDAERVAEELISFFARVGIPREILSDHGSNFMSQLLVELYGMLKIQPTTKSPYHSQTDGLVERFDKTLKRLLNKLIKDEGKNWDKFILYALFAYHDKPVQDIHRLN